MKNWLTLIISLPTENSNTRMRTWRALKASGAAVLRDGVYLMPDREACRAVFEEVAGEILASGGTAYVIRLEEPEAAGFTAMFDRREDYAALMQEVRAASAEVSEANAHELTKKARKWRKTLGGIVEIDFFDSEARAQTEACLHALDLSLIKTRFPHEPQPLDAVIVRLDQKTFTGKTWATRQRPWVDRLACAWLIQNFIDADAQFLWLESPKTCPKAAIGFDFDGATFSHVGAKVSFEVLLSSFGLEDLALQRIGHLVHFLDVGGVQPPEAAGIESVLAGMRDSIADDNRLLQAACSVFDGLFKNFSKDVKPHANQ